MRKPGKWGMLGVVLAASIGSAAMLYAVNPWDTAKSNGCYITGCNGCGSYNSQTKRDCGPKERYCSYKCDDGIHNSCMQDDGC